MKISITVALLATCIALPATAGGLPEDNDYRAGFEHRVRQVLRGYFVDPSIEQEVVYGVVINPPYDDANPVDADDPEEVMWQDRGREKFMQFQDGPKKHYSDVFTGSITTCQHSKTGLTYLVDIIHRGGNGDGDDGYVNFIGVNPETHVMEVVYREYAKHGPYDSKICGWPAKQEKLSIFSDAMSALRIDIDSESVYAPIGGLKEGETMLLPFRVIPAKTAQAWLEKLYILSADIIFINDRMHPALAKIDYEYIDDWYIIQITGTKNCSELADGVVLVKHVSQKDWRAIYNVEAGCSKVLNYPLSWLEDGSEAFQIKNDMLQVAMYHDFSGWGYSRDVVINLRTNMITSE